MRNASSIEEQLCRDSEHFPRSGPPLRRHDQVRLWVIYAKQYLSASVHLRKQDIPLLHPWAQVTGHAVECSVKSFLCAAGRPVPHEHDLVKLLDLALSLGLAVEERDMFLLVDINHLYSTDLGSRTRYKARFPSERWEWFGGVIPDSDFITRVVQEFCNQAVSMNEQRNRNVGAEESAEDNQ